MTKKNITDIVAAIVRDLTPLSSDERHRVVQASLTLLGESAATNTKSSVIDAQPGIADNDEFSAQSRMWMKQNGLSSEQIHQVFQKGSEGIEIFAQIPGKTNRDKVRNAYVLLGVARLLSSGEAKFDDKAARALCEHSGFFDGTNHMKYMKGGNEFVGSRDSGWTLTSPGKKYGANLVAELSKL
jgi:hypothetical protein